MELFWATEKTLPDGVGVEAFCPGHLAWIAGAAIFGAAAAMVYRRLGVREREIFSRTLALLIFISELGKDIFLAANGAFNVGYLPLHLCGLAVFVCLGDSLRPSPIVRETLYCLVLPGALSALLFPDWLRYPLLTFQSLQSFSIHAMLFAYPLLKLASGELRPDFRKLPRCFLLLLCAAVPIYFFNRAFGTNFLFLSAPVPGSPLEPIAALFGRFYLVGFAAFVVAVWAVMYLPWALYERLRNRHTRSGAKI